MTSDKNIIEIKLYNTESRQKETVSCIEPGCIKMYTCGPTVYDFAHIGNFRTYVFEDLLRRTLKYAGYQVTQAMNLTDVDDKTIRGAIRDQVTLDEYTQPFKDAFFEDLDSLGIERVEHYPAATDYIPQMIDMIHKLIDAGVAYKGTDGSVYFSITKFPRYGCLSHLNLDELEQGRSDRVSSDEYDKESLADFVLWKGYEPDRDGNIYWESPFGKGRPGWHLECSAMAISLLGETVDIHVGGVDNMFPHHENEIAQSESCTGKQFARLWMHSEHLIVNNKKMSKSLGNFYTFRNLVDKGYSGREVRYLLMQTHYKTQLNFTLEGLDAARASLRRLDDFIVRVQGLTGDTKADCEEKVASILNAAEEKFRQALADDLNISVALAAIYDLVREVNALIDQGGLGEGASQKILAMLNRVNKVLNCLQFEREELELPKDLLEALEQRQQARKDKNWALADELRDLIQSRGYLIEDSPEGAQLKKMDV